MNDVVEAGTHVPTITPAGPVFFARCPDCEWVRRYQSAWEAELFADVHHRRVGQIPGQLVFA